MKITVLIENTAPPGLLHEHGLSFLLEYQGHTVLLDAGAKGGLAENADRLGVRLEAVEKAALSHGHDDHSDGFPTFFARNNRAKIYARPAVTQPQYIQVGGGQKSIGVDPEIFRRYRDRFDLDDGPRDLFPGIHLVPDQVDHEQSLVAETGEGLVILNSCCHAGAGYIVRGIKERFPGQKVRALVGGFHLMGATGTHSLGVAPGIVKNLAHWLLDELEVGELYTGHCTGFPAFELLQDEAGDRLHHLTSGMTMEF